MGYIFEKKKHLPLKREGGEMMLVGFPHHNLFSFNKKKNIYIYIYNCKTTCIGHGKLDINKFTRNYKKIYISIMKDKILHNGKKIFSQFPVLYAG